MSLTKTFLFERGLNILCSIQHNPKHSATSDDCTYRAQDQHIAALATFALRSTHHDTRNHPLCHRIGHVACPPVGTTGRTKTSSKVPTERADSSFTRIRGLLSVRTASEHAQDQSIQIRTSHEAGVTGSSRIEEIPETRATRVCHQMTSVRILRSSTTVPMSPLIDMSKVEL